MTVYLDNCATTPLAPEAAAVFSHVAQTCFGNPSSIHGAGRQAAAILAHARKILADSIHAQPREILFTSSGTEANNLALHSAVRHHVRSAPAHVITTATEHASITAWLEQEQKSLGDRLQISWLPVDANGRVRAKDLNDAFRPNTSLVTILHCNNETGALQDLDMIAAAKLAHPSVLFHLDIVQSYTKHPFDVRLLPVDYLTTCSHKVHGPKGAAFLYARSGVPLEPMLFGGAQEKFRRAGTEDVAAIAAFAKAVEMASDPANTRNKLAQLEFRFLEILAEMETRFLLNGSSNPTERIPGIFNLSFEGVTNKEDLLIALDLEKVFVSSTSACHSGVIKDSHVLQAMGIAEERRTGSIRIGMSRYLSESDVESAARTISKVVAHIAACGSTPSAA